MKPYNEKDHKSKQIRQMFDNIAPRYDMLNHLLSLGIDRKWRKKLIKMIQRDFADAKLTPANHASQHSLLHCEEITRILDLATGTGDMAVALALNIGCSHITGADPSGKMLGIAKEKVASKNLDDRISFEVASAESLPFADNEFDAITVVFGVRNFHDLDKGLSEMLRVLCQGGRLYIMEFSKPENRIFGELYRFYTHVVLPIVGGLISRDRKAYRYLPDSVDEFPTAGMFREMLAEAGFIRCRSSSVMNGAVKIYTAEKSNIYI